MIAHILDSLQAHLTHLVWWVVGIGGFGGILLLVILYPIAMRAVGAAIGAVLHELLSTRIGCALLAAVIVGTGASYMQRRIDDEAFATRTAQFEQQQKQRDADIAADTRKQVTEELAALKTADDATDKAVKDFTDAEPISFPITPVPVATSDPLRVGDDACKLRLIAGLPACGSERHQRMSGARKRAVRAFHHAEQQLPAVISPGPRPAP